jgi:hypothetical protein
VAFAQQPPLYQSVMALLRRGNMSGKPLSFKRPGQKKTLAAFPREGSQSE